MILFIVPSPLSLALKHRSLTSCGTLKVCFLIDLDENVEVPIEPGNILPYALHLSSSLTIRCDTEGSIDRVLFHYGSTIHQEFTEDWYMNGNTPGWINRVDYLQEYCGLKSLTVEGFAWEQPVTPCFAVKLKLTASCPSNLPVTPPTQSVVSPSMLISVYPSVTPSPPPSPAPNTPSATPATAAVSTYPSLLPSFLSSSGSPSTVPGVSVVPSTVPTFPNKSTCSICPQGYEIARPHFVPESGGPNFSQGRTCRQWQNLFDAGVQIEGWKCATLMCSLCGCRPSGGTPDDDEYVAGGDDYYYD